MTRLYIAAIIISFVSFSCTSLKPLTSKNTQQASLTSHQSKKEIKFLDNISVSPEAAGAQVHNSKATSNEPAKQTIDDILAGRTPGIEAATDLQIRYSILLNTEVEQVKNLKMYGYIDEWYGTKYCMGGTTKNCIDCSAFMQVLFAAMYAVNLPRTAREQYDKSKRISRTEMHEGDMLFFNTTGGVSHVGMYLQNNKFVHASASGGVTISDVFDPYWVKRFIGVGRIDTHN